MTVPGDPWQNIQTTATVPKHELEGILYVVRVRRMRMLRVSAKYERQMW
jgi:hypothetical protein